VSAGQSGPMHFAAEELEALRVALMTSHYHALDEERALRSLLDLGHYEDADHRKVIDSGRADAALRAFRYHLLAERIVREQQCTGNMP